ncbi:hypothetical protein QIU18_11315 [Capnocytophaga canimorsus]|nr:hypothetical protein [Capnocytophaga canimorsus]WGU68799.1 hypothetical protein QIU19_02305 [Capnocytophaga canimorsus]WGU70097.1 hypothetical protein QIU18_11315 [Capnocytophaga canimorsus]
MKRTKTLSAMSFAAYDVERRTRKGSFLRTSRYHYRLEPHFRYHRQTLSKKDFPPRVKNPMTDSCCSKCYSSGCGTLQSEAKSEDGDTSCLLMKKRLKKRRF